MTIHVSCGCMTCDPTSKTMTHLACSCPTCVPGKQYQSPDIEPIPEPEAPYLLGWGCPACGKVNSPFAQQCSCPGFGVTYTSTNVEIKK
jgi:hypothetical protein